MALKRRIIVAGLGSIGRRHARLLNERPDMQVEFCEPDEKSLALAIKDAGNLSNHPLFSQALNAKPEMIVIATPHALHKEQTIAALEAGINVLCEKPLSDSLAGARAMQAAADSGKAVLDVGFSLHFHPGSQRLKALIRDGTLGTILYAHYHVGTYTTLVNSLSRYQRTLEGALFLDYAHQPDIFYWLLDRRPIGVYMAGAQGGDLELTSNPNFLNVLCDYDTPLLTSIHLNYLQMPDRVECEIVGDKGWALWNPSTGLLRLGNRAAKAETQENWTIARDDIYRREHQAFLDAVDGKRLPESPAASAIVSMEVIDAALKSWKLRQRVTLGQCD